MTSTQQAIISEIGQAIEKLGGNWELLGIVCSWGDTMSDEETLAYMRDFNQLGTTIKEVICCIKPLAKCVEGEK